MEAPNAHERLVSQIARIDERTISIDESIKEIKADLSSHYVTKQEFEPIKKLVYGVAALILSTVVVAVLALVVMTVQVETLVKH